MNRLLVAPLVATLFTMVAAACGLAASALLSPLLAAGPAPQEFVKQAIAGDNSLVMLGALAAERGTGTAVRQFGEALKRDHAEAREQMLDVRSTASEEAPSTQPTEAAQQERDRLAELSGAAFDRAFVDYMIEQVQADIAAYAAMAKAQSGEVSMIADIQLPTLRRHLFMAQQLKAELDKQASQ